jgi:hypothetical protein
MPATRNSLRKASNAARNNRNNRANDPAVQGSVPDNIAESHPPAPLADPVVPISSSGPFPIPTTKRARDEELERLAVEEGRLRVLKLRKEIEAIQGPLPDDEDNDDEGEIPQIVKELAPRYQQTKSSILLQILEDKFDPFDLYKLHTEFGSSISTDTVDDEFFMSKGKLGTRKRLGSPKDLGSVKRWSNAFLQYVSIVSDFKKHDIISTLLQFHAQILKLDESYQWEAVVLLALRFHRQRTTIGLGDRDAWRLQPHEIFGACNHALKTPVGGASSPRNPRSKFEDQVCHNWNAKGCSSGTCPRRHVCLICKGSHTKAAHPDTKAGGDAKATK